MRRILLILLVAATMVAMGVVIASPAFAEETKECVDPKSFWTCGYDYDNDGTLDEIVFEDESGSSPEVKEWIDENLTDDGPGDCRVRTECTKNVS